MKLNYIFLLNILIPLLSHAMHKPIKLEKKNKMQIFEQDVKRKVDDRPIKLSHSSIGEKDEDLRQKNNFSWPRFEFKKI